MDHVEGGLEEVSLEKLLQNNDTVKNRLMDSRRDKRTSSRSRRFAREETTRMAAKDSQVFIVLTSPPKSGD